MIFLIKLGGSAISDKSRPLSFREDWVRDLGKELVQRIKAGDRFILVHGGGSFAHPLALAYGLGRYRDTQQLVGVSLTSAILNYLSMKLTTALASVGLPVYPLRTGSIYVIRDGKPQLLIDTAHLMELVGRGVVPMLYGDVVLSDEGFSIISGDDIMLDLGVRLRPHAALFLTDVPGILDKSGNVIKEVSRRSMVTEVGSGHIDVTGGIVRKMRSALELARFVETYLCAIWDLESIREIFNGREPTRCTRFSPD